MKPKQRKQIRVPRPRRWGIALPATVAAIALLIVGFAGFQTWQGSRPWADQLTSLGGVTDFVEKKPTWLTRGHKEGHLTFQATPSVGGDHNGAWQNCGGDVYDAPIASENATHSLEHGAVWITYRPGLAADQVEQLAGRVRGNDYTLMSPHTTQTTPISLQAWGYQMTVDAADDPRIDKFLTAARVNAGPEQGAPCSGGISTTGDEPPASEGQG